MMNLTYCPEGGEHEWEMWHDVENAVLVIGCDRCHSEAYRDVFHSYPIVINPLPVKLSQEYGQHMIVEPRREM